MSNSYHYIEGQVQQQFRKYLLSAYYMPGMGPGSEYIMVSMISPWFHGA